MSNLTQLERNVAQVLERNPGSEVTETGVVVGHGHRREVLVAWPAGTLNRFPSLRAQVKDAPAAVPVVPEPPVPAEPETPTEPVEPVAPETPEDPPEDEVPAEDPVPTRRSRKKAE